ncbi:ATP-binding protein [Nocardia paucivorans]|uniref:ATP-binding protein n=1 Tax=Nocardia paucivorans TaxID=114259 RepID=UPI0005943437|nr:AAA family ATPase [Nocardia paucivorans]
MSVESLREVGLPMPVGEFVGRERELARLRDLLSAGQARLITLVGPGGSGKTGLAAEALRREDRNRPVYWVGLTRIASDPATRAAEVVRSVVRARTVTPRPIGSVGSAEVSDGRPILVLDSCEHVVAEIAEVIADLLAATADLTILATSREPIGWADEYLLAVPPLPPRHALRLFRQRAELTGHPVPEDPERLDTVARICRHVDHNPLFIRMAAARLRHRPPAMVLAELTGDADDKRLNWSYGVRGGVDTRHRGIRDVITWSYDLCDAEERILLERLSIFAPGYVDEEGSLCNGAESAAVVAVCADEALPRDRVERALERLVDRSLVSVHFTTTATRWYLGESVRVFAQARLRRSPAEVARLARLHRRYHRDRVLAGGVASFGARPDEQWVEWVRASWDDIVAGIRTGLSDPVEARIGLETATTLLGASAFCADRDPTPAHLTELAFDAAAVAGVHPVEYRSRVTIPRAWAIPRTEESAQKGIGRELHRQTDPRGGRRRCEDVELRHCASGVRPRRSVASESASPRRSASGWRTLSPAEREVAVLAAAGWSNSAIAEYRRSSVRTVDAQVASVRQKLLISSRREIVHHLPEEMIERVRREREVTARRSKAGRSPRDTPRP